ncbi:hypothetical protein F5Y15DRAFT_411632 [Xylariaceae sp. FL0016]|nr:hypothetical protein F5Y15DRAFT_411632 [Xylariaceae sp. FL0016]
MPRLPDPCDPGCGGWQVPNHYLQCHNCFQQRAARVEKATEKSYMQARYLEVEINGHNYNWLAGNNHQAKPRLDPNRARRQVLLIVPQVSRPVRTTQMIGLWRHDDPWNPSILGKRPGPGRFQSRLFGGKAYIPIGTPIPSSVPATHIPIQPIDPIPPTSDNWRPPSSLRIPTFPTPPVVAPVPSPAPVTEPDADIPPGAWPAWADNVDVPPMTFNTISTGIKSQLSSFCTAIGARLPFRRQANATTADATNPTIFESDNDVERTPKRPRVGEQAVGSDSESSHAEAASGDEVDDPMDIDGDSYQEYLNRDDESNAYPNDMPESSDSEDPDGPGGVAAKSALLLAGLQTDPILIEDSSQTEVEEEDLSSMDAMVTASPSPTLTPPSPTPVLQESFGPARFDNLDDFFKNEEATPFPGHRPTWTGTGPRKYMDWDATQQQINFQLAEKNRIKKEREERRAARAAQAAREEQAARERQQQEEQAARERRARAQRESPSQLYIQQAQALGLNEPTGQWLQESNAERQNLDAIRAQPERNIPQLFHDGSQIHRDGLRVDSRNLAKLVKPTAWLNDECINASLVCLAAAINKEASHNLGTGSNQSTTRRAPAVAPRCVAVGSLYWKSFTSNYGRLFPRPFNRVWGMNSDNFLAIDTILIPINVANNHWVLGIVMPKQRAYAVIDSFKADQSEQVSHIRAWLSGWLGDQYRAADWNRIEYPHHSQENGWDCGVFTIMNALHLALGLRPASTQAEMPHYRRRIAAMLLNQGFHGEYALGRI